MTRAASNSLAITIAGILAAVVLGQLVVLVGGWVLGGRTRRVVAGIGWLALTVPGVLLFLWLIGVDLARLAPLVEVVGGQSGVTAMLSLSMAIVLLSLILSDNAELGSLTGRLALSFVMLLGAGLCISGLLPVANAELRSALLNVSPSGWAVIMMGYAFASFKPWTAYGAGLLIAVSCIFTSSTLAMALHAYPARTFPLFMGLTVVDLVFVVGVLTGTVMTLYGNLRHPGQWLAAGAGGVAVVGSLISSAGAKGASDTPALVFWAGLLTLLLAPRLIGKYVLKARSEP